MRLKITSTVSQDNNILFFDHKLSREIRIVESLLPIRLSWSFHTSLDWFNRHPNGGSIVHIEILQIIPIVQQLLAIFALQTILPPHKLPRDARSVSLRKLVEEEITNR